MLKLVLHKAMKPNEKTQLSTLYDRIESHLRTLETLDVTTDKCAAMLFPLVESSLPEDLLRAWQQSSSGSHITDVPKDRLTLLIEFLRVENEERISMAVRGFGLKSENDKGKKSKVRANNDKDIPSAASLLTTGANKNVTCIFCGAQHESANCEKARRMNIEDRREVLKEKNACFNCLKIGHSCKKCRVNIKCAWCGKRHVILMCTEVTRKETVAKEAEHNKESTEESNLASISENPQVFLQTLRVKLRNSDAEHIVRAIIDTGSQRSYILKQTAEMMGYEPVGEQLITHSLFGGIKSDSQRHRRYIVQLSSLDGKYACNFKALDQDVICDST
ncbi:PREDICTED: uncharacterized protein LOC108771895 [Cyphomyrmex costatus]|uniref:uncharacterized protein LOC108771895 n=1 Tax=Cyphomyrmex costatus TaxID=456900 RepID=UPI000852425F|nr:PREDICTED: uncharacterized protein LOC108771895 [Cyphomyrmex costatus]